MTSVCQTVATVVVEESPDTPARLAQSMVAGNARLS